MSETAPEKSPSKRQKREDVSHLFGPAGQTFIQSAIQNKGKKKMQEVISEFQERVGLGLEYQGQLVFLSELGGSVSAVCLNAMEQMKKILHNKIPLLDQKQLEALLTRSFPFIALPEVRSVPVEVMSTMKTVPQNFLRSLASLDTNLFASLELPIRVRRLVWQESPKSFEEAISQHIDSYMKHKDIGILEEASAAMHIHRAFPTQSRRKKMKDSLEMIRSCIGTNVELLSHLSEIIHEKFATEVDETKGSLWLTLLTDVLVSVRESVQQKVNFGKFDRILALATFLDTLVQRCEVDVAKLKELGRLVREALGATRPIASVYTTSVSQSKVKEDSKRLKLVLKGALKDLQNLDKEKVFAKPVSDSIGRAITN